MGLICLYGQRGKQIELYDGNSVTAYRNFFFPNNSGTFALTTDIPAITSKYWTIGSGATKAHAGLNNNSNCWIYIITIGTITFINLRISVVFDTAPSIAAWGSIDIFTLTNWTGGEISYTTNGAKLLSCADGSYGGCVNVTSAGKIQIVSQSAVNLGAFYYSASLSIVRS